MRVGIFATSASCAYWNNVPDGYLWTFVKQFENIKQNRHISYFDCFAVATAKMALDAVAKTRIFENVRIYRCRVFYTQNLIGSNVSNVFFEFGNVTNRQIDGFLMITSLHNNNGRFLSEVMFIVNSFVVVTL